MELLRRLTPRGGQLGDAASATRRLASHSLPSLHLHFDLIRAMLRQRKPS